MMSLAAASTSFEQTSAAVLFGRRSAAPAPGADKPETRQTAAVLQIEISRTSSSSLSVETGGSPRGKLAGKLASADNALDRLLKTGEVQAEPGSPEADKLDRLQFMLDSLNLILKDRSLGGADKMALLGYLSNIANGQEPSEDAKAAFGEAMSDVLDRRRGWPEARKDDYRDLLGRFAKLPEDGAASGTEVSASRFESLSISIKGAIEVVTDEGTTSAEFEFTSEMVRGFSASLDDGEATFQSFAAESTSLSLRVAASRSYGGEAGSGSVLDSQA
jgi:hypothetical protein